MCLCVSDIVWEFMLQMYISCFLQSTTSTDELCVYGFGGTSASCPMMSGAIALALEAKLDIDVCAYYYFCSIT